MRTDMPLSRRPTSTVSMLERIGQPALLSVTPSPASSAFWPSAVAPPWLPMAGTTKGSAPQARTRAAMAATRTGSSAMPRLPTLRATRMPGRTALAAGHAAQARAKVAGMSSRHSSGKDCV